LPVFKWKIHDEYREIANHNCRKASTIIFDSLYIIIKISNCTITIMTKMTSKCIC
jgi:GLPGLI family protein